MSKIPESVLEKIRIHRPKLARFVGAYRASRGSEATQAQIGHAIATAYFRDRSQPLDELLSPLETFALECCTWSSPYGCSPFLRACWDLSPQRYKATR